MFEGSANLPSFHKVGLFQCEIQEQEDQPEIGSYPISRTKYYFVIKEEEKTEFCECIRWKFLVHFILSFFFFLIRSNALSRFEIEMILLFIIK